MKVASTSSNNRYFGVCYQKFLQQAGKQTVIVYINSICKNTGRVYNSSAHLSYLVRDSMWRPWASVDVNPLGTNIIDLGNTRLTFQCSVLACYNTNANDTSLDGVVQMTSHSCSAWRRSFPNIWWLHPMDGSGAGIVPCIRTVGFVEVCGISCTSIELIGSVDSLCGWWSLLGGTGYGVWWMGARERSCWVKSVRTAPNTRYEDS